MVSEIQKAAWNTAIKMLSRREHTRLEITRKLSRQNFDVGIISDVLDQLIKAGFQSDERFTGHYIRFRSSKGYGPSRIRLELSEKGVEEDISRAGLEQAEINWLELAESVRLKKFGELAADTWQEKGRQKKFLDYRGFTHDQIQSCIDGDEFD